MTPEEAIKELEIDMELMSFDDVTGEIYTPEELECRYPKIYRNYLAEKMAIQALKEKLQKEEIKKMTKQEAVKILDDYVYDMAVSLEFEENLPGDLASFDIEDIKLYSALQIAVHGLHSLCAFEEILRENEEWRKS